jgi:hypothetical protein
LSQTKIFHLTDIENLRLIIASGGLLSKKQIDLKTVSYVNIAYDGVQDRRATTTVPCGPGGVLHDYVPFYFAARSPMLLTIKSGNVPGYTGGQDSIVYLTSTAEAIAKAGRKFVFTDGHGIMFITEFFDDLSKLTEVDWDIMRDTYWANTEEDGDRKRRRQAEFLVHEFCPWELIETIAVKNQAAHTQVSQLIGDLQHKPVVKVEGSWYY